MMMELATLPFVMARPVGRQQQFERQFEVLTVLERLQDAICRLDDMLKQKGIKPSSQAYRQVMAQLGLTAQEAQPPQKWFVVAGYLPGGRAEVVEVFQTTSLDAAIEQFTANRYSNDVAQDSTRAFMRAQYGQDVVITSTLVSDSPVTFAN